MENSLGRLDLALYRMEKLLLPFIRSLRLKMKIPENSLLFATAFYHAAGKAPNAWTFFERSKLTMYYRCMIVCYASIRRLYPEAQLMLFSNRQLPEPFNEHLNQLQVSTVICTSRYIDDPAFKNDFPGCLFSLDVIEHLVRARSGGFSYLVLLDSDCIVRYRFDAMVDELVKNEKTMFAYELGYPANTDINGQSRASLTLALSYFSGQMVASPIPAYGGEFLAVSANVLPELAKRIEIFWEWMKSEGVHSLGNGLTEEHVMSVIFAEQKELVHNARKMIKRIWTASVYSNVDGSESQVPIWHLPAEKKRGFAKLYRYWSKRNGFAGLSDGDFMDLVDKTVALRIGRPKYHWQQLLMRLRVAAKVLVTGGM